MNVLDAIRTMDRMSQRRALKRILRAAKREEANEARRGRYGLDVMGGAEAAEHKRRLRNARKQERRGRR